MTKDQLELLTAYIHNSVKLHLARRDGLSTASESQSGLYLLDKLTASVTTEPTPTHENGNDWQPIETAPKDGTRILLCRAIDADGNPIDDDTFGLFVQRAAWWEGEGWVVYCSMPSEPRLFFDPTHWMHIPKNPLRKKS